MSTSGAWTPYRGAARGAGEGPQPLAAVKEGGFAAVWGRFRLRGRRPLSSPAGWIPAVLAALVVLYAGALRFEALSARFGLTEGRPELRRLQRCIRRLHPRRLNWARLEGEPYTGDPYRYLHTAREMRRFYDASVREPVFVGLTKVGLYVLDDRDLGISLVSSFSSVLLVAATYLLGRCAFSPWVGLLAGFGMAVERYVIGLSLQGWRDDTFAFFVVLWCFLLVRFKDQPSFWSALLLGLVGGGACLTRITALSFVLPGYGVLLVAWRRPSRRMLELVAVSLLLSAAVVGPFLINCAIVYGDPFYAVNYHTSFYLQRSGRSAAVASSWLTYLGRQFRPFELMETLTVGLTSYPFANKWNGFEYWCRGTGSVLSWLSVLGGLLMVRSGRGRAVVIVFFASLLPFAFTYRTVGGAEWRFTLHAYPFYLIASAVALTTILGWLEPRSAGRRWIGLWCHKGRVALGSAMLLAAVGLGWVLLCGLHYMTVRETIQAGRVTIVDAGYRDRFLFGRGWLWPERRGNNLVRVSRGSVAVLRLPLRGGTSYRLDFRLSPLSEDGLSSLGMEVLANGARVSELAVEAHEKRMGEYAVTVPPRLLHQGRNRIELKATGRFLLWFVRVSPLRGRR